MTSLMEITSMITALLSIETFVSVIKLPQEIQSDLTSYRNCRLVEKLYAFALKLPTSEHPQSVIDEQVRKLKEDQTETLVVGGYVLDIVDRLTPERAEVFGIVFKNYLIDGEMDPSDFIRFAHIVDSCILMDLKDIVAAMRAADGGGVSLSNHQSHLARNLGLVQKTGTQETLLGLAESDTITPLGESFLKVVVDAF